MFGFFRSSLTGRRPEDILARRRLVPNDDWDQDERFTRKPKRKPRGRERLGRLQDPDAEFPGLAQLRERGVVDEVLGEIKSGKEADVYLARGPGGELALKIYRDPGARGFKPDPVHLEGRRFPKGRMRKVLDRGARAGVPPELALWVLHEVQTLWRLVEAGVPVPRPAHGPDAQEILAAGRIVPMAFLGRDGVPAPRLADVQLSEEEAEEAWRQSYAATAAMLRAGIVHGDLSAWNLLWHEGEVVVIDVPQAVEVDRNPHAALLFARDVSSLTDSFRPMGLDLDASSIERELRLQAGLPPVGPFER